jgi:hypothetical protein
MKRVRATIVAMEKQLVLHTDCAFVVLVSSVQRASAMLSSVAYLAPQYFSTLPDKRHGLRKPRY